MTLIEHILQKVQSKDALSFGRKNKYSSPPPEIDHAFMEKQSRKIKRKIPDRYPHVVARVDSSPPVLHQECLYRYFNNWTRFVAKLQRENIMLVMKIKNQHIRGKVDYHWDQPPRHDKTSYEKRKYFFKQVTTDNRAIYERIISTKARVTTTASLEQSWRHHRREMVARAALPFVLFPSAASEQLDPAFLPPPALHRPRVRICLRVVGGACLGWLTIELFTDMCPLTCRLFSELLRGDGAGHTYIGTCFFRKVPHLYWSGGDVIHDNGFGCYLQRGRRAPLGAENYHYPHSIPGLVSMRMTRDDEMCGIFNITFKPLPQFDLKNVVFGRVVRPSNTYDIISSFGNALSTYPVVQIESAEFLGPPQVDSVESVYQDGNQTFNDV